MFRSALSLKRLFNWLGKSNGRIGKQLFTDLTPVDHADPDGCYAGALSYAFENQNIRNIALTGPYGSGKSSIIRTYEKRRKYRFLNISLASFKEEKLDTVKKEKPDTVSNALIERSILQQMLYGADAAKLPYSRFKRISKPRYPRTIALLVVMWASVVFFLYPYRYLLASVSPLSPIWLIVGFVFAIPVVTISDMYKATFGIQLKRISLMNAEIETGETSKDSILNRHLDEIIYFFQETKYDVVVIEDLDRFEDTDIFVKLREINKLINENISRGSSWWWLRILRIFGKSGRPLKFLYALKDDMFVHKDRTKFFDFIIPVVPIINTSNSLDKILQLVSRLDIGKQINEEFLREVSLYIDDLRLIYNIFNELSIYYDRLKSESLDVTKLLAMMIYKNSYPDDFERLHSSSGVLFRICAKRTELLQNLRDSLKRQREEISSQIRHADAEQFTSIEELISAYIGHLIIRYYNTQNRYVIVGFVCTSGNINLSQMTSFEQFRPMLSEKSIRILVRDAYTNQISHQSINKSFSEIETEVNPLETFDNRMKNIENKSSQRRGELQKQIQRIDKEITELPYKRFSELVKSAELDLEALVASGGISNGKLLVYLTREGYLDENYNLYTSNFHEGRLTINPATNNI